MIATRMEIVDGKYTGEIGYYAYAREQGRRDAASWPSARATTSARSYAYSDSVTDVHMLEAVGNPYAVNPDRELRRHASQPGVAGPRLHPAGGAGEPGATAREPSRRWRPWPSGRRPRWAARSTSAPADGTPRADPDLSLDQD